MDWTAFAFGVAAGVVGLIIIFAATMGTVTWLEEREFNKRFAPEPDDFPAGNGETEV